MNYSKALMEIEYFHNDHNVFLLGLQLMISPVLKDIFERYQKQDHAESSSHVLFH